MNASMSGERWARRATLAALALLVGCSEGQGPVSSFRLPTMPPSLEYLPQGEIRTAMWVVAAEIQEIERLLDPALPLSEGRRRDRVREALARLDAATKQLETPGRTTQHPLLNRSLPTFRARIERGRRAVDRDPPDYFPVTAIAGSCALCHGGGDARG